MDNVTLGGAIALIVSTLIRAFGLLARLRQKRDLIITLSLGFLIGSSVQIFQGSSVNLDMEMTFGSLILLILCLSSITMFLVAAFKSENQDDCWVAGTILLIALGFGSGIRHASSDDEPKLRTMELDFLVDYAIENGDLSRAVDHLYEIKSRINRSELRQAIDDRIESIEKQELEAIFSDSDPIP